MNKCYEEDEEELLFKGKKKWDPFNLI